MSLPAISTSDRSRELAAAALDFCEDMLRGNEIVFIAGSVARGTAHEGSDVDIVIIVPGKSLHLENYETDNVWHIQCASPENGDNTVAHLMIAASGDIEPWLYHCMQHVTAPFMLHMLATGVLIQDQNNYGKTLQKNAQKVLANGPVHLPEAEYQAEVSRIREIDLSPNDPLTTLRVLMSLYDLTFSASGTWPGIVMQVDGVQHKSADKYLPRSMQGCVEDIQKRIIDFMSDPNAVPGNLNQWVDEKLIQIDAFRKGPSVCPIWEFFPVIPNIGALLP